MLVFPIFLKKAETEAISSIDDKEMNDWIDRMSKPRVFGDQYCLKNICKLHISKVAEN